jgi:ribonuclease R
VDRLVMVCEMVIQHDGRISEFEFHEAVIKSHRRLTYTQVHKMIEANNKVMRQQFADVVPQLEHLYELFNVLHQARDKRGAIDFDMPETKIVYGKDRKIEKIVPYERFNSHRVIEECMLCANISAANFLQKHKQPGLYRVHEGPRQEKLDGLQQFLTSIGLKMPAHRAPVPADYAHILRVVRERPDANMIQTMLLRSMSQAVYSPDNKGHFGLSYDAYAHFTSPIRRYPDLLVHRSIKHILNVKNPQINDGYFNQAGEHCSMTERRADDATSEVTDWLKCEFMMDKVGQEFMGKVSGVTNFGVFIELADFYVEGLVHISTLPDDYYQFDPVRHELLGEHTRRSFRIGDEVKIQVARVNLDQCEIDFVLAGVPAGKRTTRRKEHDGESGFDDRKKKKKNAKPPRRSGKSKNQSGKKKKRSRR